MSAFHLGDIEILVTRKDVKHVHLSVHPPEGRVTLVAPSRSRLDVLRAYVITRMSWIRKQQAAFRAQARETPRRFITRETHYLWGRRYLLEIRFAESKPSVRLDHKRITLTVRPGSGESRRAEVLHEWHKAQLHQVVPELIRAWEPRLRVKVRAYYLQRMRTRWGSCNHARGNIRLNTELVKKPRHLLEYVVVHEMAHLLAPTHDEKFVVLLDQHFPLWREARAELNRLPLGEA
ncbi:M48 family metallopeptidase [Lysobacter soli]|uniref:M48 family metallopeptidase n=1 Tax=Lysobacter soli TaxID=453783 RepID=UPI0020A1C0E6|nr:SprT family zinc-dependent metalloprotease [Lysobacter soli]UTA55191.1 M48 family metallopeptidase [Lysobacter soli]